MLSMLFGCAHFSGCKRMRQGKHSKRSHFPLQPDASCVYIVAPNMRKADQKHIMMKPLYNTQNGFFRALAAFVKQCSTCSLSLSIALFLLSAFFHFQRPKRLTMRTNRRWKKNWYNLYISVYINDLCAKQRSKLKIHLFERHRKCAVLQYAQNLEHINASYILSASAGECKMSLKFISGKVMTCINTKPN